MKKYDKSLIEVWGWKDAVYKDTKNLTSAEFMMRIRRSAEKLLAKHKITLKTIKTSDLNHMSMVIGEKLAIYKTHAVKKHK